MADNLPSVNSDAGIVEALPTVLVDGDGLPIAIATQAQMNEALANQVAIIQILGDIRTSLLSALDVNVVSGGL